jgi:ankyrin repeat protein
MFKTIINVFRTSRRFFFTSEKDIHVYAAKGNVEKILELLEDDPTLVNLVDKMDFGTPLHWAAVYGQAECCKVLISNGADLELVDDEGKTPLWWAINGGELEVCRLLLARGANANVKNSKGQTPLVYAKRNNQKEIAALLRKHGSKCQSGQE